VFAKEYNVHPDILSTGYELFFITLYQLSPRLINVKKVDVIYFVFLQGYIWNANSSSNYTSLLHFVGTLKQIFDELKKRLISVD
jgi:hypothetical protein